MSDTAHKADPTGSELLLALVQAFRTYLPEGMALEPPALIEIIGIVEDIAVGVAAMETRCATLEGALRRAYAQTLADTLAGPDSNVLLFPARMVPRDTTALSQPECVQ